MVIFVFIHHCHYCNPLHVIYDSHFSSVLYNAGHSLPPSPRLSLGINNSAPDAFYIYSLPLSMAQLLVCVECRLVEAANIMSSVDYSVKPSCLDTASSPIVKMANNHYGRGWRGTIGSWRCFSHRCDSLGDECSLC